MIKRFFRILELLLRSLYALNVDFGYDLSSAVLKNRFFLTAEYPIQ